MPDTLSQLIAKVQAGLLDDGTLFPAATVTTAVRQSLADINRAAPQFAAATIASIADQLEYELSDEDALATGVIDVLLEGDGDSLTRLEYDAYVEDSRWFFKL